MTRLHRPAVGEPVDLPPSTADGRTSSPPDRRDLMRQLVTFGVIGVASTIVWALLYMLLRHGLNPVAANGLALVVTTIGNTAANRRLTFGIQGRDGLVRDHGAGLAAFALALGLTTGAAALLGILAPHASRALELAVLITANAVATLGRFVLLRTWVGSRAVSTG